MCWLTKRESPDYGSRFYKGICLVGELHDQVDTKWIVIKRQLWGHNDTPIRGPAYRPPGVGGPHGVFGVFSY
jgi:hypothetical protein